jgi:phosphatidylserine decarboxylase
MSPNNVHVNWAPISGVIKFMKYHPGKYLVAWHPKSSTDNERTSVVIENHEGVEVLVRQIAGALARRIVCYAREGNNIRQGDEFGFIKFGSRVDLYLPVDAEVKVKIGDKVSGKRTVIAHLA